MNRRFKTRRFPYNHVFEGGQSQNKQQKIGLQVKGSAHPKL